MPDASTPNDNGISYGSMGLSGWMKQLGNFSAMMIVGALVLMMWWSSDSRAKEDRELYQQQWKTIADEQATLAGMRDALRDLTDEMKEISRRQRRVKSEADAANKETPKGGKP